MDTQTISRNTPRLGQIVSAVGTATYGEGFYPDKLLFLNELFPAPLAQDYRIAGLNAAAQIAYGTTASSVSVQTALGALAQAASGATAQITFDIRAWRAITRVIYLPVINFQAYWDQSVTFMDMDTLVEETWGEVGDAPQVEEKEEIIRVDTQNTLTLQEALQVWKAISRPPEVEEIPLPYDFDEYSGQ